MTDLTYTMGNGPATMSSREIAELVNSRHDKVKQSIERLADRGVITLPPMGEASFLDRAGKTQWVKEYRVGKRDSYVIVAQLSPEFTARLVDRWQELETGDGLIFLKLNFGKRVAARQLHQTSVTHFSESYLMVGRKVCGK